MFIFNMVSTKEFFFLIINFQEIANDAVGVKLLQREKEAKTKPMFAVIFFFVLSLTFIFNLSFSCRKDYLFIYISTYCVFVFYDCFFDF